MIEVGVVWSGAAAIAFRLVVKLAPNHAITLVDLNAVAGPAVAGSSVALNI